MINSVKCKACSDTRAFVCFSENIDIVLAKKFKHNFYPLRMAENGYKMSVNPSNTDYLERKISEHYVKNHYDFKEAKEIEFICSHELKHAELFLTGKKYSSQALKQPWEQAMIAGSAVAQIALAPKISDSKPLFFLDALISIASIAYTILRPAYLKLQEEKACDLSSPDINTLQGGIDFFKRCKIQKGWVALSKLPQNDLLYIMLGIHHPHPDTRIKYLEEKIKKIKENPNHTHKELSVDKVAREVLNN